MNNIATSLYIAIIIRPLTLPVAACSCKLVLIVLCLAVFYLLAATSEPREFSRSR